LFFFYGGRYSFEYFGDELISTQYLQQVILAAMILVLGNFVVYLGAYFNFRSLQRYFYSRQVKTDVSKTLTPWQRILLYLVVYFGLFSAFLIILRLVMLATR
jgi:hypothetical protein